MIQHQVKKMSQEISIPFEAALQIVDIAVMSKASRHLRNIEIKILRGVFLGQKYEQIAAENGYAPEYIKNDVGPKLWQILSSIWGEKVSKSNLMAVLAQRVFQGTKNQDSEDANAECTVSVSTKFESPVRPVPLDSNLYLERPQVESRCYEEIMKPGALIHIKAPWKMGKTSLMLRILDYARQQNSAIPDTQEICTVALNLERADSTIVSDLDKFLRWFCTAIIRKLQLPHRIEDYWDDTFGSKSNCTAYFEDYLLPAINGPLVLALDKMDEIFLYPEIANDFLTLLHSWYEEAAYGDSGNPVWQNLRLIIVQSTEVYIPLNINTSSFNAGLTIELQPFTSEQVLDLVQRYELYISQDELSELMQLVAGHPYLVQQILYQLTQKELTLNQIVHKASIDTSIYSHHIHRHLRSFQEQSRVSII